MKFSTGSATACALTLLFSTGFAAHATNRSPRARNTQCSSCDFVVGTAVNTTSGLVQGHPATNTTQVSEYLGIPFAKPPVGNLRFAPPERYYSSSNVSGAEYGHICPQTTADGTIPTSLAPTVYNFLCALGSCGQVPREDCLTLNVWSKPQSGSAKKPVMVWIYGGGFKLGGTNSSGYSGQYWVDEEDVVFVNFNYRLGIFGFPGSPALQQNVALLDQRMALEWVRDNIANFGGDPERITVFGESAGAASVDYYNYIWTKDPIIQASITQSGTATSFGNADPVAQAARWYALTKSLGCGDNTTSTPAEVVACMRDPAKVTMATLLNATEPASDTTTIIAKFGPTVDNITVFGDYASRAASGQFIQKPLLTGSNDDEAALFELIYLGAGVTEPTAFWTALTLNTFTCPANTQAYARWRHNVPVWRYRYFPSFPNIDLPIDSGRAYHSSEILPMFNSDQAIVMADSSSAERATGAYTRGAWAAFAHCPTNGLTNSLDWPEYSPSANGTDGLVLIGMANGTGAVFSPRGVYDVGCPALT